MRVANWDLPNRHVGRRVEVYDSLDSTNSLALERSREAASAGLALLAHEQRAGRGQFGRTWQAPPGSSVLLSVVLFPPDPVRRPALLTAWAAVSVCELIARLTDVQPRIKWPNDVLLQGKKVCGILIEQRAAGAVAETRATVAGIGLNVRQDADFFDRAQLPLAGSLLSVTGRSFDSEEVTRRLLAELDLHFDPLVRGDTASLEAMWCDRLGLLGRDVVVELAGSQVEGKLREIAFAGLVLETVGGDVLHLQPEAVKHVKPC